MRTTEQLGRYTLTQEDGLPKLGRDALVLAEFATLRDGWKVCDLGCGVGVLGLLLAERADRLTLDGADIQHACAELARENLAQNGLSGIIIQADVAQLPPDFSGGSYDLVIANPPYFSQNAGKTASGSRGIARTGEGFEPWCRAARRLLKNGGRFALCCRPWDMNALFHQLTACQLEPKRLRCVQSAPGRAPNLILVEAAAQGRPGLEWLPVLIRR